MGLLWDRKTRDWYEREHLLKQRIANTPPMRWAPQEIKNPYLPAIEPALRMSDWGELQRQYDRLGSMARAQWVYSLQAAIEVVGCTVQQLNSAHAFGSMAGHVAAIAIAEHIAEEARGRGQVEDVPQENLDRYLDFHMHALELAREAWESSSGTDVTPLVQGQGAVPILGREAIDAWAQGWREHDPWNVLGWRHLMRFLDHRWHGTWESLPEMAHHLVNNAPAGHPLVPFACRVLGHHWNTLLTWGDCSPKKADALTFLSDDGQKLVSTALERFVSSARPGPFAFQAWDWLWFGAFAAERHSWFVWLDAHQQGMITSEVWTEIPFRDQLKGLNARRREILHLRSRYERPLHEDRWERIKWGFEGPPPKPGE